MQNKRVIWIDMLAIAGIFVLLVASVLFNFEKYLFRLPFVTLFAFYGIGKYMRDLEIRIWDKKHASDDPGSE